MSYDPERQMTDEQVLDFMTKLYEGLAPDDPESVEQIRQSLEARGIDTQALLAKGRLAAGRKP